MATEKRLIDANALKSEMYIISRLSGSENICIECIVDAICDAPTVDAVEVEKYKALLDMYHDLRDNFIDYYCSGTQNVAPYCLNKCEECVDKWGYCKQYSDHCKGFNPAEVII